jgi:LPS sulfotransferase NodH
VLEAVFPDPHFIWMTREDTLAQAVSWWKAMTTRRWTDGQPATGVPTYDAAGIAGRLRRIEAHNRAWERWFDANEIEPLRVTYEQLAAEPSAQARRVLEYVGVEVPDGLSVVPRTKVHADATNRDWIERFQAEPPSPAAASEPARAERPRAVPVTARLVAASFSVAVLLCLLFVALPEELGDWPYNVLGH